MTTIIERVKFKVNGVDYEVGCEVTSKTTLVEYLRKVINIPGTKYMCLEGGCGACTVSVCRQPGDPEEAVNSCLVSITSCQGWEITTIEGLGNRKKGYHILQETLAKNNGSQCGHCTPGWIMAMYSLVQRKKRPTMKEIEQNLSSNVCRCTGYRSIFKAFKEFASDAPNLQDIEDLYRNDRNDCNTCNSWCFVTKEDVEKRLIKINLKDIKVWYRVSEIEDIFEIFTKEGDDYLLVAGNTAKGAYPISEYPRVLIDISGVEELMGHILDQNLVIGAGTTLTNLIDLFEEKAQEEYFTYLDQFRKHLTKVAHVAVRNLASVAGNLMLKHEHREFPSDIFLLLECVGAQLTLCSRSRQGTRMLKKVTMQEFLNTDMKEKIILNILIPPLSQESKIVTYKIMPRGQSAIAIVNAAFNYKVIDNKIVECSIVYGGLSDNFTRAKNTERCLKGEKISNDTLQKALKILDCELVVTEGPPKSSVEYRRHLALALFYKSVLTLCTEDIVRRNYRSGTIDIHNTRPASVATQVFKTDPALWPLNQPIPKVDGLIQCAGEAVYTDDIPRVPHETAAAFVLSSVPTGEIVKIDATEALNYKGVLAFYTAKDIPGLNSFTPADDVIGINNEEVFCDTFVKYHSQPLGLIVAETAEIANIAVKLVEVTYKDVKTPVLSIEDAKRDASRVTLFKTINATARGDNVVKVIKGSNSVYGQYHFPMENIVCLTQKTEEGLRVDATAQWFNAMQLMISRALKLDQNRIDLHMRRLGGSYGLKVSRSIQTAVACSQVAYLLNRPCRLVLPLQVVTKAVGKRLPCDTEFEIGVDSTGKIQYMNYDLYEDNGYLINEQFLLIIVEAYNNCYDKSAWNFRAFNVITDTHKNSWFRAPGHIETVAMAEYVMEQIAYELQLDPIDVRVANLSAEHLEIKEMIESIRTNSNYDERRRLVEKFNSENRWVKRGLRLSIMQWSPRPIGRLHVTLSVYHGDGTIALTHSGIELGQGLNTKAIQICAYLLNIPTHKIQVKENNTIIGPNVYATVGSLGGQNVALGVTECCEELLKRLEPIRSQMPNASWEDLIQTAFEMNVDLQTHGFVSVDDTAKYQYSAYGVAVAEVEVDILTGECEVIRVDLEEDVGLSMSPLIDIGQVEGAFIMGQGYWTCEDLVYDRLTGEVLTDRSWNYHVPLGTDIPQDFRVYLREKSYTYKEIFGSKAVGEPPICLSIVIAFAIREAISSARCDLGIPSTKWFPIKGPYTVEKIALAARTKIKDFKI